MVVILYTLWSDHTFGVYIGALITQNDAQYSPIGWDYGICLIICCDGNVCATPESCAEFLRKSMLQHRVCRVRGVSLCLLA